MIKLKQTEKSRHILQKVVKERIARDKQDYAKARDKQINKMQNEIRAQGAVNDMIDNAVENSGARQSAANKIKDMIKLKKQERLRHAAQKAVRENVERIKREDAIDRMHNEVKKQYEQQAEATTRTEAGRIINSASKRAVIQPAYNDVKNEIKTQQAGSKINSAVQAKVQRDRYIK